MKKIISLVSVSIFAIAFNTQLFAQNHRWDDIIANDSLTVKNPQEITTDGPYENDFFLNSKKSQPPSNKIQKNNSYDVKIISIASSDLIIIQNACFKSVVEIYNTEGKSFIKNVVTNNNFNINVSDFPKGIYIIVVNSENQIISKKIAIQ